MRTKVLNHFHTFHPEAQAEFDDLARQERKIQAERAARGEEPEAKPQRASAPAEDLDADLAKVRERMDELRATIASGVVRIHIKGLTRGEFRRLMVEHAPREDQPYDMQVGYNVDTFGDALIQAAIIRTDDLDGEPVENRWDEWADEMTNGQWEEVFRACLSLTNDGQPSTLPR